MHYILYGIITLGIIGGVSVFYIEMFKFVKTMWKDSKILSIFIVMLLLCLLYYIYRFLEIGFHAFFN